jgi:hypothetical protein
LKSLQVFIAKTAKLITNNDFIAAYRNKPSYFSRSSAKLTFETLLLFLLTLPRQSAQCAINRFIKERGYEFSLHKQSLFEAREKLSHRAFIDLNNNFFLPEYAYCDTFKTHHGLRVIAVDGSVFDVPAGADYFGTLKTCSQAAPKAQVVAFTDVMNEYIIRAEMYPYGVGETNITRQMFSEFWQTDSAADNLFMFDRGFFSRDLAREIYDHAKFLFRVNCQSLKEINEANACDQTVIRSEKGKPDLRLRVINYTLPNGEIEKLVTNIFDTSFSAEDFGELYRMRWGVETCFLTLKSRLQIENFSSAKRELILQDFHASVFVYNMMIAAINEAALEKTAKEQSKYIYKPNKNIAIAEIRNILIDSLSDDDPIKRQSSFMRAMNIISRSVVPIRNDRSLKRTVKYKSAKFPLNKKSGLA